MSLARLRKTSVARRGRPCLGRGERLRVYRLRVHRTASGWNMAAEQYLRMRREYHAGILERLLRHAFPPEGPIFAG